MSQHFNTLIIGAGFGGLGMAIRLRQKGETSLLVLEKGHAVGGCWRDNRYPGAACDVPSHLYSFSFEPKPDWSRRFAPQPEIETYLRHCAEKYDLMRHIRFHCEVRSACFDEANNLWQVTTNQNEKLTANILITATGQLNRPMIPVIKGAESFQGPAFHSAEWPADLDLNGKRVAVIGTGASAIQFVPEVAKQAARLTLFQRSAAYVIPKADKAYSRLTLALLRRFPLLQKLDRGRIWTTYETRVLGFTSLQWAMHFYRLLFRYHLNRAVKDVELRRKLTPDYPLGCKRILLSNDYFPALAQPNVAVECEGIDHITAEGIVTRDGTLHPADVIIYGTGFRATEFLSPIEIIGRNNLSLNQAWQEGAEAYLGITVHGFPNLFMLYGPNTNLGHSSIIYMLESQIHYVLECLRTMQEKSLHSLEVRADIQASFNASLQTQIRNTVWEKGCTSWYKTESGKNTNNWPGFTFRYRANTREVNLNDYQ